MSDSIPGVPGVLRSAQRVLVGALALSVALWAGAGILLSLVPRDLADGDRLKLADFDPALEARNYASPGGVIAQFEGVSELRLKRFLGGVVWEATGDKGAALFDARTARRLTPLDENAARAVAERDFSGAAALAEIRRLERGDAVIGDTDVWRVTFKDGVTTRVYVSASTGEVLDRRNRLSPVYDVLHGLYAPSGKGGLSGFPPLLLLAVGATLLLAANRIVLHRLSRLAPTRSETRNIVAEAKRDLTV